MILLKGFIFKLRPTPAQEQLFRHYAGAVRWVWNAMLHERQSTYRATGKSPSMYEQQRKLPLLKAQPETAWLANIHSQVLQAPIHNLQRAFVNFFEGRAKYPRYKSKKRGRGGFTFPQGVKGLARTRLAKSIYDAGWGMFLRQLSYKCAWQGKLFHQIDRFFPSTKLHLFQDDGTPCGHLNTTALSDRLFVCQGCGEVIDRDRNAAFNIKWRGLKQLQERPPDSRAYTLADWT